MYTQDIISLWDACHGCVELSETEFATAGGDLKIIIWKRSSSTTSDWKKHKEISSQHTKKIYAMAYLKEAGVMCTAGRPVLNITEF